MNVGDLVMVDLSEGERNGKERPGLILRFDDFDNVLVLTGPRQLWRPRWRCRPFPAASMAQSRRAARHLENRVIKARRAQAHEGESNE